MKPHVVCVVLILLILPSLACSLPSTLLSGGSASEPPAPSAVGPADAGSAGSDEPDMLDATLELRSVRITLEASYPDGYTRNLTAEIDADGKLHLVEPFDPGPELQGTLAPPAEGWGEFELFVVDGRAYTRMPGEPAVQDDSYISFLEEELRGPEGPGLWLLWVGTEDLEPDAHEPMGSFSTVRYPVDATINENSTIQGTLWMDEDSLALVRADLTISPELFSTSAERASGDLTIRFRVSKAQVSPVSLP